MPLKTYTIKLHDLPAEQVALARRQYGNGRLAILLECDEGPYAKATVNLPNEPMEPDEVAIKNYGENEGMLEFLLENGIVEPPHRVTGSGRVAIPICRLKAGVPL